MPTGFLKDNPLSCLLGDLSGIPRFEALRGGALSSVFDLYPPHLETTAASLDGIASLPPAPAPGTPIAQPIVTSPIAVVQSTQAPPSPPPPPPPPSPPPQQPASQQPAPQLPAPQQPPPANPPANPPSPYLAPLPAITTLPPSSPPTTAPIFQTPATAIQPGAGAIPVPASASPNIPIPSAPTSYQGGIISFLPVGTSNATATGTESSGGSIGSAIASPFLGNGAKSTTRGVVSGWRGAVVVTSMTLAMAIIFLS